jgi:hypothetical protein
VPPKPEEVEFEIEAENDEEAIEKAKACLELLYGEGNVEEAD